jgi:hypothetical protein
MAAANPPERIPAYEDFELLVRAGKRRSYPVEIRSTAGELQTTMRFPLTARALEHSLLALENALLRSASTRRVAVSEKEQPVQEFGQALFDALLAGDGRSLYDQSLRSAEQGGKGLRLKLRIDAPELASLPWEVLYDRRNADYVALSSATPIVRELGVPQPIDPLKIAPPLRILGVIADPSDLAPLAVDNERRRIEAALEELEERGLVTLRWLEGQTWRALQQEIRKGGFHVLHFTGHGGFDPEADEGLIMLANDAGKARPLRATDLAMLLADEPDLRLVVLNSCDGARGGAVDIFSSTASILIRRGIPAVLAMQHEITDPAAIEFSRSFYSAIADGMPVDCAVAEGRKAIRLAMPGSFEWVTPVLYQRAADGVLFEVAGAGARPPALRDQEIQAADVGADDTVAAPSGLAARVRALPRAARYLGGLLTAISTIVAIALGVSQLWPEPAPNLGGTLSDVAVAEQSVSLGDFCAREQEVNCSGIDPANMDRLGVIVTFTSQAQGYKDQDLPIKWTVCQVGGASDICTRPSNPDLVDQFAWPHGVYTPAADNDQNSGDIWVTQPFAPGDYFVRLEFFQPDGTTRLDTADTSVFTVT